MKIDRSIDLTNLRGRHRLTGIGRLSDVDGYVLEIDGTRYTIYEEEDDGYRSRCAIEVFPKEKLNDYFISFPEQDVEIVVGDFHYCDWIFTTEFEYIDVKNPDGTVIFEAYTEDWDNWYPQAHFTYNPENLPINKDKA